MCCGHERLRDTSRSGGGRGVGFRSRRRGARRQSSTSSHGASFSVSSLHRRADVARTHVLPLTVWIISPFGCDKCSPTLAHWEWIVQWLRTVFTRKYVSERNEWVKSYCEFKNSVGFQKCNMLTIRYKIYTHYFSTWITCEQLNHENKNIAAGDSAFDER